MRIRTAIALALLLPLTAWSNPILNKKVFHKYWQVESESPDYRTTFLGDTCEIVAPKGLTLWHKQQLSADVAVEYDACVMDEGLPADRLSDMNVFWLASDPGAKSLWDRAKWRSGIFNRCYSLQMYYFGYGGNHNTTTRFRRYTGDEAGIDDPDKRPVILKEYNDPAHLLQPNRWYHWRIETRQGRTRMYVNGELLVDYLDPQPLNKGWFGFRTTLSRTRFANFRTEQLKPTSWDTTGVPLRWLQDDSRETDGKGQETPVSFGVPFAMGELKDVGLLSLSDGTQMDAWVNAHWPDGSVKWAGIAAVIPEKHEGLRLVGVKRQKASPYEPMVKETAQQFIVNTGRVIAYIPKQGRTLIDSLTLDGLQVGSSVTYLKNDEAGHINHAAVERTGRVRTVIRLDGSNFIVRLYFYRGSKQIKMVHTMIYDGQPEHDIIRSLGIRVGIPLREEPYNRHVAFTTDDGGVWAEPVQVLEPNNDFSKLRDRQLRGECIDRQEFTKETKGLQHDWAQWDGYRLSQLTDNAYSIRKRATDRSPWIGTLTGLHGQGYAYIGDTQRGMSVGMKDFWQSYPSTIQIDQARSSEAQLTMWLWSPEAEPMNLCHYDTVPHGLKASYEDVQPGMSTPYGIARTSTLWLQPEDGYHGKAAIAATASRLTADEMLLPTPAYLHEKRAFGIWSLPKDTTSRTERRLRLFTDHYSKAIEEHKWYGFWNYGDIMHAYDPERHVWRYDVGGFAWDNTELATPMWLWYNFLRTGDPHLWQMAEAMTRHCSEVDVYHIGSLAPLGSRHNVSHWGCGAKEARISQAAFNRFYYYLTTDERTGDLMAAQRDADTLLYHLDPMRLAEPRSKFPTKAPARLRIGPDWLAYVGNWMTEWERTGNTYYRDKIRMGMQSIAALPDGVFTGNLAKGYDPATGRISYDGPKGIRTTNHLKTIMGGFELMNELMPIMKEPDFNKTWLQLARDYKRLALEIRHNRFPVRRLEAYAAWQDRDPQRMASTWEALWHQADHGLKQADQPNRILPPETPFPIDELPGLSTNNAALWSLDAIFMLEVLLD